MIFPIYFQTIYLIRHGTVDWEIKGFLKGVHPGPPLTAKGEQEAQELGVFLQNAGVQKLYYGPRHRSAQTAQIAAAVGGISAQEEARLTEWIQGVTEAENHAHFWPVMEYAIAESAERGPVGLVTHAGAIFYFLKQLGIDPVRLEQYRHMFDRSNPLPPAGVWAAQRNSSAEAWDLQLVFTPLQVKE